MKVQEASKYSNIELMEHLFKLIICWCDEKGKEVSDFDSDPCLPEMIRCAIELYRLIQES